MSDRKDRNSGGGRLQKRVNASSSIKENLWYLNLEKKNVQMAKKVIQTFDSELRVKCVKYVS